MSARVSDTVVDAVGVLLAADVESVDADGLQRLVRGLGGVRAWVDAFEVRCARRSKVLAARGRCGPAESTLTDQGRRSGRDAAAAADRERVCDQMGSFENALAEGRVSAGHLDALARATRRLDDDTRGELAGMEAELLAAAETERVETFERRVRDQAKLLASQHAGSDAAELDRQRAASTIKRWTDKTTGMRHTHLAVDPLRDAALWSVIDTQVNRARQHHSNANTPWAQLQINTLINTITTGAAGQTGDEPGQPGDEPGDTSGGVDPSWRVPEATVLIDLTTLTTGLHANSICELEDGTPLPVSTMRRLLCDCEALPVVLGANGQTLDAGRTSRTATQPQRRALRAMHRTCAHPHCTVGFNACRIHHIRWWWHHHGPTNLDNLIPLCERHHHLVHEGGWQLAMTPDRTTTWTRPDGTTAHTATSINRAPNSITPPTHPPTHPPATGGRPQPSSEPQRARKRPPNPNPHAGP